VKEGGRPGCEGGVGGGVRGGRKITGDSRETKDEVQSVCCGKKGRRRRRKEVEEGKDRLFGQGENGTARRDGQGQVEAPGLGTIRGNWLTGGEGRGSS